MNDLLGSLVLLFIAPLAVYPLVMVPLSVGLLLWFVVRDAARAIAKRIS